MATPFKLKRSAVSGKRPDLGDLQLGELALNFYDGHLFARRETNGVGIADTVSILTPWIENFGGTAISYGGNINVVGISTFSDVTITGALSVSSGTTIGLDIETRHFRASGISTFVGIATAESTLFANQLSVSGVTTFFNDVTIKGSNSDLVVEGTIRTPNLHNNGADLSITGGGTGATRQSIILPNSTAHAIQILGNSTGTGGITLDTRNSGNILLKHNTVTKLTVDSTGIEVNGHSELDTVRITGLSTFTKDVDVNAAIVVAGISTFENATDNTLGDPDTGSVQIDGGLGVNKNVSIGGSFYVGGYSEFVGVVTFRGGTINIGDADTDDVNIGGEFVSSLIPNADGTYNLGSTTKRWKNGNFSGILTTNNLYASGITTTVQFNVGVGGTVITTTDAGNVGINSTQPSYSLDVVGDINSSTDLKINGTSVLSLTASQDDIVALAIALG